MSHADYVYRVIEVAKVVDGDTVDLVLDPFDGRRPVFASRWVDQGFHVFTRVSWFVVDGAMSIEPQSRHLQRVRLLGVDTPERGQPGWAEAADFGRQWFAKHSTCELKCETRKSDSFGRYLGTIYCEAHADGLNTALLIAGHGVLWIRSQDDPTQEV
jgi:endonuclease YncB( thermonuclease family)